ncbi:N-acetylneuraminate synthase [Schaedlerella arabinosiphila]|jgi:N-acetylneuraminate synthase|uniref:N-acetylneuraminate synthase n=1 Tax=Schaedlerella arabinosiphila TaxID=2044587 RepID=A0A9X5H4G6_9FIRM|nr:N-acetylneuraminate synthase [Schaedlerella arabinosiphila]KAI4441726.1 N,N'-diacetyllegionaminic acid synthase [Schaedlerella arabinosiphila]NDO68677.1 N-acetylneuraminate synthase [Schaedlerella arabinosiphila]
MNRILIIAEAGVNHNGSLDTAKALVMAAKECGADVVKFQTINVDELVSKQAVMADYQKNNLGTEESQKDMLKKLALKKEDFYTLADYCRETGIKFLSTPFDIESIHFLNPLQDMWKVPSGEITNYPYLVEIGKTGKEVILSTGMSTLKETADALEVLNRHGAGKVTLLHCTTEYPAPLEAVNLRAMMTMQNQLHCRIGYSDHTKGIEIPVAAAAMGARIIEKHFTLNRNMPGPDHMASLEPEELKAMIMAVRNVESALGDGIKAPSECEKKNIDIARKSIVARRKIKKGEQFSSDNITAKRPGSGVNPMRWNEVIGRCAVRDFDEDELIQI